MPALAATYYTLSITLAGESSFTRGISKQIWTVGKERVAVICPVSKAKREDDVPASAMADDLLLLSSSDIDWISRVRKWVLAIDNAGGAK